MDRQKVCKHLKMIADSCCGESVEELAIRGLLLSVISAIRDDIADKMLEELQPFIHQQINKHRSERN